MKNKNFYIADTHFFHKNVIQFDNRPFDDLNDMHETLIKNWNNRVGKNDIVYILGDFCFFSKSQYKSTPKNIIENQIIDLLNQLSGKKILIVGNHDETWLTDSTRLTQEFEDIACYKKIKDENKTVILSHYPIIYHESSYSLNSYMLCGHVHNHTYESQHLASVVKNLRETYHTANEKTNLHLFQEKDDNIVLLTNNDEHQQPVYPTCNIINVGCMMPYMGYQPRQLDEIIENIS